jgi:hypothetical protein
MLREKGFIITMGSNGTKKQTDESINEKDENNLYLWDEPWMGSNGPRWTSDTTTTEDEETATQNPATPTAEYGTATPVALTKITTQTVINNPLRKSGGTPAGIAATQERGVAILPAIPPTTAHTENPSDTSSENMDLIIQGNRSFEEILDSFTNSPLYSNSLGSPSLHSHSIGSPSLHSRSIGFPSVTTTRPMLSPFSQAQSSSERKSWAELNLDFPIESKLKTAEASAREKTYSWLDDGSRDSVVVFEDREDMGRERVRSWKLERRADEIGWDGSI